MNPDEPDQLEAVLDLLDAVFGARLLEFYYTVTHKVPSRLALAEARDIVGLYSAWPVVLIDTSLILSASRLEEAHQVSFWDALVLEAARVAGAGRLLSEHMQDGRVIEGARIENPFRDATVQPQAPGAATVA